MCGQMILSQNEGEGEGPGGASIGQPSSTPAKKAVMAFVENPMSRREFDVGLHARPGRGSLPPPSHGRALGQRHTLDVPMINAAALADKALPFPSVAGAGPEPGRILIK